MIIKFKLRFSNLFHDTILLNNTIYFVPIKGRENGRSYKKLHYIVKGFRDRGYNV